MGDKVHTHVNGHIFEVTLDNPKANAIGAAVSREMNDAFIRFRDDPELWVAILTGAGDRFFCTGWDLNDGAEDEPDKDFGPYGFGGVSGMFELNKPVIMAINGYCVAGGFELALSGDLMVASENAEFFLSEVNVGLTTSGASISRLMSRLPRHIAMELLLTGRHMSAQEALDLHLVNRVTPQGQVMDAARELAETIAAAAPLSVQAEKQMVDLVGDLPPHEAARLEKAGALTAKALVNASSDAKEGARAFVERRKPVWTGR
ncbi:MAG: carnitinyl-CoA dehydratase [Rhodospirillaceae bacterium]|jgi:crotonobetainyl-CoA hydratase|nr:carnitinyl-CoA dehydratase [Rhodospirillaceae bacterium]MBT7613542.1 carnitinyl-CoA dehydratase [Rhodospirillaceae bacterium]